MLTYRALNNLTPGYLTELFTPLSEIHSLNLRSSENELLHVPLSHTALFDNSFTCSAPKPWNTLPQTVRASGSLLTFKKNHKIVLTLNKRDNIWFTSICDSIVFSGIQRLDYLDSKLLYVLNDAILYFSNTEKFY